MKKFAVAASLACLLLWPSMIFANADGDLEIFFKNYLEELFKSQPLEASRLGDHRFDGELEDLSAASRMKWRDLTKRTLIELPKKVRFKELSRDGQIDFEILQHQLKTSLWLTDNLDPYAIDPRIYGGYINESVYILLTQSTLPKETNIANCLSRMAKIPSVIAAARQNLRNPARPILDTAIRQNRGAISFYETEIFELAGQTPQLPTLKTAAESVVKRLHDYQYFLEKELAPRATGEWRLGRRKFASKLELVLDAGVGLETVRQQAQSEFDRVRGDLYVVARQLWSHYFPGQTIPPDDKSGRRETIQRVVQAISQDHGSPAELLGDARQTVGRIKDFIGSRKILTLPDPDRCQVVEMPEFRRGNSWPIWNRRRRWTRTRPVFTPSVPRPPIGPQSRFRRFSRSTIARCCKS
jgi:uncharacterized protein (DUF885 family)